MAGSDGSMASSNLCLLAMADFTFTVLSLSQHQIVAKTNIQLVQKTLPTSRCKLHGLDSAKSQTSC